MTKSEAPKVGSISNADVEKLLELESKATEGTWVAMFTFGSSDLPECIIEEKSEIEICNVQEYYTEKNNPTPNFRFIAESRNLLRPLCLDWLRLKEENEKMREALDVTLHFGWRENKKFEEWIKGLEELKKGKFDK